MEANSHHYPSNILEEKNQYRSIKLLVKKNKSYSGAGTELLNQLQDTGKDLLNVLDFLKNKDTSPASTIGETKNASRRTKKLSQAETIYGIALPLPNELSDAQGHQWESTKGFVGSTIGELANTSAEYKGIKGNVNQALGELASASGFRKPLIDPGYFQDYNGTTPREFSFSWDLVPDSQEEAENIVIILYNLKKFTLPTTTLNGVSLLSPYMFELQIGNPIINDVMNMNNVVCKTMTINYSAEGALQFFENGIPKYMKLEMSFAERSVVTSNYY